MPKSENMSSLWSVASSVDLFVVKPRKPKTKINFIDVLIGLDYYFDVVSGNVIHGKSHPVAVGSMFGWILSGHTSVEDFRKRFLTTNLIIE